MSANPRDAGASAVPAEISRDELLTAMRRRRVTLVDVLSPESYASAHIAGAISLPVADISASAAAVLPDRASRIVVYCGGPS